MISKETFLAQVERAALMRPGEVATAILSALAADLKKGEPAWWKAVAKAWEERSFVAWNEAWLLFLTALHFEALSDEDNPLVPYFPSCGGSAEVDPAPGLAEFLRKPSGTFLANLQRSERRSWVPLRAPVWNAPAGLFFLRRDLPFYLLEINAGGGLNLAADLISPEKLFDSSLIAARVGLDPRPLMLEDINDRRWLTAAMMPDDLPGIAELDKAIDFIQERKGRDPNFIQLAQCAVQQAPGFIAKNVPADDAGLGLMVFNAGTTARMTDADYQVLQKDLLDALTPWGDRALWVEMESVRGEMYSTTNELRVRRVQNGAFATCVLAKLDPVAKRVEFAPEADAFLAPPAKS